MFEALFWIYIIGCFISVVLVWSDARYHWIAPDAVASSWKRKELILISLCSWLAVSAVIAVIMEYRKIPTVNLKFPQKLQKWLDEEI